MKHRKIREEKEPQIKKRRVKRLKKILFRALMFILVTLTAAAVGAYGFCYMVLRGPSEKARDEFVEWTSSHKAVSFVPYAFLPSDTVDAILAQSSENVGEGSAK